MSFDILFQPVDQVDAWLTGLLTSITSGWV